MAGVPETAMRRNLTFGLFAAGVLMLAQTAHAQGFLCEDSFKLDDAAMQSYRFGPPVPPPTPIPQPDPDPLKLRLLKYATVAMKHRLSGLARHYSTSLAGH